MHLLLLKKANKSKSPRNMTSPALTNLLTKINVSGSAGNLKQSMEEAMDLDFDVDESNIDDGELLEMSVKGKETASGSGTKNPELEEQDVSLQQLNLQIAALKAAEDGEANKNPSGTIPLMTQDVMGAATESAAQLTNLSEDELIVQITRIIDKWLLDSQRSITQSERHCLITAVLNDSTVSEKDFNMILFGFRIRGEQNIVEVKNIQSAMQVLLNGMTGTSKEIRSSCDMLLTGAQKTLTTQLEILTSFTASARNIPESSNRRTIPAVANLPQAEGKKDTGKQPVFQVPPTDVTAQLINDTIKSIQVGEAGYIDNPEDFYKLVGRTRKFLVRSFNNPEIDSLTKIFLEKYKVKPTTILKDIDQIYQSFCKYLNLPKIIE